MNTTYISNLYVFPVKSLQGIELSETKAGVSGLEHDRQWAIINAAGQVITQRKKPQLVRIRPEITPKGLVLHSEQNGSIDVLLPSSDGARLETKVWQDYCMSQSADKEVNTWLNDTLKTDEGLRLVKLHPQSVRRFAKPERFNIQGQFFSDAAPYLVANMSSLEALNQKLRAENLPVVDIRHFRANIVISGPPAFSEHQHGLLSDIDQHCAFRLVDHCQRCSMITVDPDKGEFLPESTPFKTLAAINPMPGKAKAPAFGVNATLINSGTVSLKVGQKLVLS